jgi:hypothetical protein
MKPINSIWRNIDISNQSIHPDNNIIFSKVKNFANWINYIVYSYKIFIIILFIILSNFHKSFPQEHGTVIISVIRNDTIWIGADSKVKEGIFVYDTFFNQCKIRKYGDFVFTSSGIYSDENFDVDSILTSIQNRVDSFNEIIDTFTTTIIPHLKKFGERYALDLWERKQALEQGYIIGNPTIDEFIVIDSLIRTKFKPGSLLQALSSVFAKFINGKPRFFFRDFYIRLMDTTKIDSTSIYIQLMADSTIYNPNENIVKYYGVTPIIRTLDYSLRNKGKPLGDAIEGVDVCDFINFYIKEEIKNSPLDIGEPISIIRLTKDRIEWIQNGLCEQ